MRTLALAIDNLTRVTAGWEVAPPWGVNPGDVHFGIGLGIPPPNNLVYPMEWLSAVDLPVNGSGEITGLPDGWHVLDGSTGTPLTLPSSKFTVVDVPDLGPAMWGDGIFLVNDNALTDIEGTPSDTSEWSVYYAEHYNYLPYDGMVASPSTGTVIHRGAATLPATGMVAHIDWCAAPIGNRYVWFVNGVDPDVTSARFWSEQPDRAFWTFLLNEDGIVSHQDEIMASATVEPTAVNLGAMRLGFIALDNAYLSFYIAARTYELRGDARLNAEIQEHIHTNYPLLRDPPGPLPYLSRSTPAPPQDVDSLWTEGTRKLELLLNAVRRKDRRAGLPLAREVLGMWMSLLDTQPDRMSAEDRATVAAALHWLEGT
jgi:hypothetical protein